MGVSKPYFDDPPHTEGLDAEPGPLLPRTPSSIRIDPGTPTAVRGISAPAVFVLEGHSTRLGERFSTMSLNKKRTAMAVALVLMLAAGAATLPGTSGGDARAQEKGTWQDLVFLYTTDIKGKIEPCG